MADSPVPTLLAMLICDQVITDAQTKKKTLVGVFDHYLTMKLPLLANLAVYAKLTDCDGTYTFKFRVVNLKNEQALFELSTKPAVWKNPLQALELGMNFRGIPFAEFSTYEFQLYANDVYVGRATITVTELKLQTPGAPPTGGVRPPQGGV